MLISFQSLANAFWFILGVRTCQTHGGVTQRERKSQDHWAMAKAQQKLSKPEKKIHRFLQRVKPKLLDPMRCKFDKLQGEVIENVLPSCYFPLLKKRLSLNFLIQQSICTAFFSGEMFWLSLSSNWNFKSSTYSMEIIRSFRFNWILRVWIHKVSLTKRVSAQLFVVSDNEKFHEFWQRSLSKP